MKCAFAVAAFVRASLSCGLRRCFVVPFLIVPKYSIHDDIFSETKVWWWHQVALLGNMSMHGRRIHNQITSTYAKADHAFHGTWAYEVMNGAEFLAFQSYGLLHHKVWPVKEERCHTPGHPREAQTDTWQQQLIYTQHPSLLGCQLCRLV